VRIEKFVELSWYGVDRSLHNRGVVASAFLAEALLALTTTEALT
jgi:hypothetical protein